MGWARRAKQVIDNAGHAVLAGQLQEVLREASTVANDLVSVYSSGGVSGIDLSLDAGGLRVAEEHYRRLAAKARSVAEPDLDLAMLERLLAIFLGQVLVALHGARWAVYSGNYNVVSPVVIQLPSGRYLDVFGFCTRLSEKRALDGASRSEALVRYVYSSDRLSFP